MLTKTRQVETGKAAAAAAEPSEPAAPGAPQKAAPKKVRRKPAAAQVAVAEPAGCDVPSGSSDASTVAPASEAGAEAGTPNRALFDFLAENDSPPLQVPSSQPSGAELLYRLSVAVKQ
ncbi:unnamed protein product [Prorocentrum cordatum]|uniref:Uncharacterized protein n=1 Tax=Prorocentrum cordatum TaxID=2364126 RepID=A0ABN9WCE8_9DINO|nr:unnamed protein product [Polarella glacialis]